jgi:penicillin-binding protein 1A
VGPTDENPEFQATPAAGSRPRGGTRVVIKVATRATVAALFVVAALLGTVGGVLFAYGGDLPEISALDNYRPNTITRLLASNGEVIGEFATERRVVVGYDDIAPVLRQAIIATEDADFEQHFGLSISRIFMTAMKDVVTGQRAGASTITQQLARNLFLQASYMRGGVYERSLERKIREAILAVQLERRYTKREIFTLYANQVPLHGAYGVEAGSRMYFNKSAKDLTLDEAATMAAVIQTPARLSPFVNPDRTLARRNNYVLPRMAEEGFVTRAAAEAAAQRPIALRGQPTIERSFAAYFVEDIRKNLEQRFGAAALYETGLQVQTTLDVELQRAAERALDRGLRRLDKRRGVYRKAARTVAAEKSTPATYAAPRWSRPIAAGDIVPAVVMSLPKASAGAVRIRIGVHELDLPRAAWTWTRKTAPADLFREGDIIDVAIGAIEKGQFTQLTLDQTPVVEGALLAVDNRTGQIRAMVGGFDFARSKFNRATQARRQVGSLFKPILYAAAIDRGFTAETTFIDEPVSYTAGPNQPPYRPLNYDRKYEGPVTLRRALEDSRNIPAVKALEAIGPETVVGYAKRMGLTGNYPPYLSLALGAAESTLLEMTSAYSAFANQGVRMAPYAVLSVLDREGTVIEENRPEPHEALRADTAYLMAHLLRGVVQRGTAAAAESLNWPLAGKTGTMDEYTDAWFVGFDPNITVGVWVGYDEKKPLGGGETGAAAALPIWIDFLKVYLDKRATRTAPPQFEAPGNIIFVTLPSGVREAFINGTQPAGMVPDAPAATPATAPAPAAPDAVPASAKSVE